MDIFNPTITRAQQDELYDVHHELCVLHSRIHAIVENIHDRGFTGAKVLGAQCALGDAVYELGNAISETDLIGE
jgi:hypothetical protein